jgi:hypothetical protein
MVKLMKKLIVCLLSAVAVLFVTCSDPIFYNISQEEEKLDPKIPGSPTNFVVFRGYLYVASGETLFMYEKTDPEHKDRGIWHKTTHGGKIFALADAGGYLYILCEEEEPDKKVKKVLKRSINGTDFEAVVVQIGDAVHNNILSIYSANNMLFLGAGSLPSLYILLFNGDNFQMLVENTGNMLLNGTAFNGTYYLTAKDLRSENVGGLYSSNLTPEGTESIGGNSYLGIINLKNASQTIVTIDQDGKLYYVPNLKPTNSNLDYPATGALAVWESENGSLLLAGRQDKLNISTSSGYTYGYMECYITADGVSGNFTEPGTNSVSTVNFGDNGKYRNSIGQFPVNDIIQCTENDGRKTLFASTQKDGVYSYRQRDGESWSWNAEQ